MAKWKLCRQTFGNEEFTFKEGDEVTIGRGLNNDVTLSSLVISRNHCVINFQRNHLIITDLKSSNGIFVGTKKILPNTPFAVKDSDLIGIGWTAGVTLGKVNDSEKFVFKVFKDTAIPIIDRITFQNENEFEEFEEQIASFDSCKIDPSMVSLIIEDKPPLKRKNFENNRITTKSEDLDIDNVCIVLSDSDTEQSMKHQEPIIKKPKLEPISEEPHKQVDELNIKTENEFLEFEAFHVKQEYLRHDDEPITLDSDSDSESEHWYLRLSQNSPGKPFTKISRDIKTDDQDECSYSQMDDDPITDDRFLDEDELYMDDLITIPPQSSSHCDLPEINNNNKDCKQDGPESCENNICTNIPTHDKARIIEYITPNLSVDVCDGISSKTEEYFKEINKTEPPSITENEAKKAQLIAPQVHLPKKKSQNTTVLNNKSKHSKCDNKGKHSSKIHISNSQKEERKKKLKEIAMKERGDAEKNKNKTDDNNTAKPVPNIKITASNRGAFLTDVVQVVKPMKRKDSPHKSHSDKSNVETHDSKEAKSPESHNHESRKKRYSRTVKKDHKAELSDSIENKNKKHSQKSEKNENIKVKLDDKKRSKDSKSNNKTNDTSKTEARVPLKSLKPLTETEECISGKPYSKVEPLPPKKVKKSVRFSDTSPEIHYFEIEEGNKMKKTSSIKTNMMDIRQAPLFSLEKITLIKILRWNPHWLEEQLKFKDPPPILGHNNPPLAVFHSFSHHNQYVELIGDLLLMEIWECLSLAHKKIKNQTTKLQMRIASLPPVPTQECSFDLYYLNVDVSLPTSDLRFLPRVGEILLVTFGSENGVTERFFFVHNVKSLPSPPSNRNSFYNISLQATYTVKMKNLKLGEVMTGISLASINNELSLFEAMAYLAGSPLSEVILRPEPRHFIRHDNNLAIDIKNQWTTALNPSQQTAVRCSVGAALSDQPWIQMVQGPPGTGKSSVICAIVMSYFYDSLGKMQQNRGKILICATSNAAVDELVIRLLSIRQSLPKQERFRMVRVGRAEAMHPRARDVSSQQLAQRDAARAQQEPVNPALSNEISHLEAKINMWKAAAMDAQGKDPMRVAYCETRISEVEKRIALLRGGGSGHTGPRPDQLLATERRIVEGADVILSTLSSAQNHKMRGLKRRIALCVIDEAGQAIEPETLIPLMLDVTKLTLIGDPQQLPGYICSPRAKKHGLGESLFSRLTSSTETWPEGNPVLLLDQQYRMHPAIADYPHRAFYGGRVRTVAPQRPLLDIPPYVIIGISSGDKGQNASGANEMEAWGVARLTSALAPSLRQRSLSLAIITPYNAHKDIIRKNLRQLLDPSDPQIEVNTVDGFQGQERDVVVVSLARSHGVGFLTDAGRMNVMLTRARHALLICLNPQAVLKNYQWRTLVEDAQKRNLYKTLPYKMCQPTGVTSSDEIIKYISTE